MLFWCQRNVCLPGKLGIGSISGLKSHFVDLQVLLSFLFCLIIRKFWYSVGTSGIITDNHKEYLFQLKFLRLKLSVSWCSWESDDIADVAHARDKQDHAFKSKAKASVRRSTKSSGV